VTYLMHVYLASRHLLKPQQIAGIAAAAARPTAQFDKKDNTQGKQRKKKVNR
jgi:hypothetical protein